MWSYNDDVTDDPLIRRRKLLSGPDIERLTTDLWACGAATLQSTRGACPADAADLEDRRHLNQELRVGRVSQAGPERRAHDGRSRLDRRQWRPGQLPASLLGCKRRGRRVHIAKFCHPPFQAGGGRSRSATGRRASFRKAQVVFKEQALVHDRHAVQLTDARKWWTSS
jgi:hypothetical protein